MEKGHCDWMTRDSDHIAPVDTTRALVAAFVGFFFVLRTKGAKISVEKRGPPDKWSAERLNKSCHSCLLIDCLGEAYRW
eukprot:scaffold5828_cov168-Amphora_coffeaeformis.AAC.19